MEKRILNYAEFLRQEFSLYSNEHLFDVWNKFCFEEQDGEGAIYRNDENFLSMFDKKAIAKGCSDGEYDVNDEFVVVDPVFENWTSSDCVEDLIYDIDDLTAFYIKNKIHIKEYATYCQQFKDNPDFVEKTIRKLVEEYEKCPEITVGTLLRLLPPERVKQIVKSMPRLVAV